MLRRIFAVAAILLSANIARAGMTRFDFTGTIFTVTGVPNAGTTVSGYITFDPTTALSYSCGNGCGGYDQSAPATFYFSTNGGFILQQTLTAINIRDKFADGITDYYVFDADVGVFSATTNFSRLELTLSDNSNPSIANISIPRTAPDFSMFQFHIVLFIDFSGYNLNQRVEADLTSLTSTPEPSSLSLLGLAIGAIGVTAIRKRV